MALELSFLLLRLEVEHFDCAIFVGNYDKLVALVEYGAVGRAEPGVKLTLLLDHSDIPDLVDTITVSTDNHITPQVELSRVHCVVMTIECLHAEIGPDIPQADGLIAGTGDEH